MNQNIFKAYDIRGKYPLEINRPAVRIITQALITSFSLKKKKIKIVVGHDARKSSQSLYREVLKTAAADARVKEVFAAGLITTPTLYLLVNMLPADGGLTITASHDPKNYNGVKMVGPRAVPISGKDIYEVVSLLSH